MQPHPLTQSPGRRFVVALLILLILGIHWALLVYFGETALLPALIDSLISVGVLTAAGYWGWYAVAFVSLPQAHILPALLIQIVCLGVSFLVMVVLQLEDSASFLYTLPLRFLFGLLLWIILMQWYWLLLKTEAQEAEVEEISSEEAASPLELIDKISVKAGSRIHIVHLHELFCLQASGDYVTLFTTDGQYVKEQTMKYFESHLPPTFVRIHRSTIINSEFIMRVELFGKESYQVRLKNGQSLRASTAGYKLLKQRLAL